MRWMAATQPKCTGRKRISASTCSRGCSRGTPAAADDLPFSSPLTLPVHSRTSHTTGWEKNCTLTLQRRILPAHSSVFGVSAFGHLARTRKHLIAHVITSCAHQTNRVHDFPLLSSSPSLVMRGIPRRFWPLAALVYLAVVTRVAGQPVNTIFTPYRTVNLLAGQALSTGVADGTGAAAKMFGPNGVAMDSSGAWRHSV